MEDMRPGSPLRLSELAASVSTAVAKAFGQQRYWVIADVTNHTHKTDPHYHYFDLVEKDPNSHAMVAKFTARAWGAGTQSIVQFEQITGQKFTNNINVLVNVSVQFHAVYGLQLNLNEIDPNFTLGVLLRQRRATLQRLLDENPEFIRKAGDIYITRNKELPLPRVIQRLAVVSSRTSAGWQDFKHKLEENAYGYRFFVDDYFTVVQGEANVQQLVDRLVDVFRSARPYDAVVIIRGGGSQTDFLIFEHYLIGKAIAKFPIPVITGIGHHKNESIADLMAHTAVKTPSEAAEFIVNHNHAFENAVAAFQKNIVIRSQQFLAGHLESLYRANQIVVNHTKSILFHRNRQLLSIATTASTRPRVVIYNKLNDLKQVVSNLRTFKGMYLKNQHGYLEHLVSVIRLVSPENTLRRGFALIKAGGRVTSDPDQLAIGQDIEILLRDKSIISTVKSKQDAHGNDFNL